MLMGSMKTLNTEESVDRWKEIAPMIERDLISEGIDIEPSKLPELLAKSITKESRGNKGLCFIGSVGSGKTRRMKFLADATGIEMLNAREMCAVWRDAEGDELFFQEYCNANLGRYSSPHKYFYDLIIDDLGTEGTSYNAYGTTADVMRDIILPARHAVFPAGRTFITTNLNKEQLLERYGERVFSRLNEMCVIVPLIHGDRRMEL